MTDPRISQLIPPGMVAQQVPRPPTPEQLAEVEHVRGIQIRTEALRLAIAAQGGQSIGSGTLLLVADEIARFLANGSTTAAP